MFQLVVCLKIDLKGLTDLAILGIGKIILMQGSIITKTPAKFFLQRRHSTGMNSRATYLKVVCPRMSH